MLEALIPWVGSLSVLVIVCRTTLAVLGMHYKNQEKIRLERFDRQLQLGGPMINEEGVLGKIVEIANSKQYPYQIGEAVMDELKRNKLMTESRASYIMLGAENHRGG